MSATPQTEAVRVWHHLLRLNTSVRLALGEKLKDIGISVSQCDVLGLLIEDEGLSQQSLADRLSMTKGNISGLLDRLAEAGLVERRSTDKDRRSFAIYLTPKGRYIARTGLEIQTEYINASIGKIQPPKLAVFESTLIEMKDVIGAIPGNLEPKKTL